MDSRLTAAELQAHFTAQKGNPILSNEELGRMVNEVERGDFDYLTNDYAFRRVLILLLINLVHNSNNG